MLEIMLGELLHPSLGSMVSSSVILFIAVADHNLGASGPAHNVSYIQPPIKQDACSVNAP